MPTATETQTLTIERTFAHSQAKLWRALTESPLLAQWLVANDFAPTLGHKFQFRNQPVQGWDGIIDCEVLALDPITRLAYTWASMGLTTVVNFTLTPTADGTHLTVEQSGFPTNFPQAFNGAKYGWTNFLTKLDTVLEATEA